MFQEQCVHVNIPGSRTLAVLIHGQESSKADWLTPGDYTKGGDLTRELRVRGISWLAHDLYGHGDWQAREEDFDPADISDEIWPDFVMESVTALRCAIESAVALNPVDSLVVVGYSTGNTILVKLLAERLPVPVRGVVMASVVPEREMDDEYALHQNLGVLEGQRVLLHTGLHDAETSPDEVQWFFSRLPAAEKRLCTYHSGHDLPVDWVHHTVEFLFN